MAKNGFSICRPSAILSFKNFHFWSRDCRLIRNLLMYTKFYQNRTIFHKDMVPFSDNHQFWNVGSCGRRPNKILSKPVQGLRLPWGSKFALLHWLDVSPLATSFYNSVSINVLHCDKNMSLVNALSMNWPRIRCNRPT